MKKNFLAPSVRISTVNGADIITTSNINVGNKLEGTDGHPVVDDAAAPTRSNNSLWGVQFRH